MLAALDWLCLLLQHGFKDLGECTGVHFNQIVEAQSVVYTLIIASKCKKIINKANDKYGLLL